MKKSIRIIAFLCLTLLFITGCDGLAEPQNNPDAGSQSPSGGDGLMKENTPDSVVPDAVVGYELYTFVFPDAMLSLPFPEDWKLQRESDGKVSILIGEEKVGYAARGRYSSDSWKAVRETVKRLDASGGLSITQYIEQKGTGEKATFRQRVYISSQKYEDVSFTVAVDYAAFHEASFSKLLTESRVDGHESYACTGMLEGASDRNSVLILGNSFIGTSCIGAILKDMMASAPVPMTVEAQSRGYARVSTYTSDTALMSRIRNGEFGYVFICGFYNSETSQIEALRELAAVCEQSNTVLTVFPAHNEAPALIFEAVDTVEGVFYIPWRSEINAFLRKGVKVTDLCINDSHQHSTPLAGYIGAHMIYRALMGEVPDYLSDSAPIPQRYVEEKLGTYYVDYGILCTPLGKSYTLE